jgi:hypothetical protein
MRWMTIAVLAAVAASAAIGARAEVLDRVLAVVGTDVITLTDVTAARDFGLVIVPANTPDPTRATLTQLIDRALMLAEVERYAPPEPTADAVSEALRIVRGRFANDEAYQAALARSGIDESRLRDTIRQNLRITAYLNQRFIAPIVDAPPGTSPGDRQRELIDDWLTGLRRRGNIVDLYLTGK